MATAEGKVRSARNSLRHGFTSAKPVNIPAESREESDSILAALVAETNPSGEIEANLIEELAIAKWRLNRVRRAQETLLAEAEGDFLTAVDHPETTSSACSSAMKRIASVSTAPLTSSCSTTAPVSQPK